MSSPTRPILTSSGRPYRSEATPDDPAPESSDPDASAADEASGTSAPSAPGSAFADLSRTPENHFLLHFHAAVYALAAFVRYINIAGGADPEEALDEQPFLKQYLGESVHVVPADLRWEEGTAWWANEIRAWEADAACEDFPLRTLTDVLNLSIAQRFAFVMIGMLEEDSRFGTLFAGLQAPLTSRRPTLELVNRVVQHMAPATEASEVIRPLLSHHLVDVIDQQVPRAEWALRVPPRVWEAARGDTPSDIAAGFDTARPEELPEIRQLVLDAGFLERVRHAPDLIESGQARTVVVRGTPGSDRRAVVHSIACALGRGIARVQWTRDQAARPTSLPSSLGPMCTLAGLMPVLETELGPGETRRVPSIPGYAGPIGVCTGPVGGFEDMDAAVTLTVPPLTVAQRRELWKQAFATAQVAATPGDLDAIAQTFRLPGRYLRRAAASALRIARLDGRGRVTVADVREACRSLNHQHLDAHAEKMTPTGSWSGLVVAPSTADKLRELEQRCRHRETLIDHLGAAFGDNATPGVRALFTGPSGTGKTLAAKILTAEIGMDLYRVDLAAVLNKYVGETEKNLHRVLQTAEELDVVLLLDEGDSLLGRRTDVTSANDRYANVETNYLLQRLEHYRGIVLVTTNLGESIDPAFQRRMDVTVEFRPPRTEERLRIWQLHLPDTHSVSPALLDRVAARCILTGGQIRNAALHASLLALDDAQPVNDRHLQAAVESEYRKAGATCPLASTRSGSTTSGVQQFIRGL